MSYVGQLVPLTDRLDPFVRLTWSLVLSLNLWMAGALAGAHEAGYDEGYDRGLSDGCCS